MIYYSDDRNYFQVMSSQNQSRKVLYFQNSLFGAVCETELCGIIDQSLFYIDLTVHYIQHFESFT